MVSELVAELVGISVGFAGTSGELVGTTVVAAVAVGLSPRTEPSADPTPAIKLPGGSSVSSNPSGGGFLSPWFESVGLRGASIPSRTGNLAIPSDVGRGGGKGNRGG